MKPVSAVLRVLAILCLLSSLAFAVDVGISPDLPQFLDSSGNPLASGKVFTYVCGTTTDKATYTDSTGNTAHANPIILDSGGFPPSGAAIWLAGCTKLVVKTSADVTIRTVDNINILPPWAIVSNPTGTQTIDGAALSLDHNFTLLQNTAATAGANQDSYSLCLNGSYWTGAASGIDQWCFQDDLGSGSNPTTTLKATHTGSSGTTTVTLPANTNVIADSASGYIGIQGAAGSGASTGGTAQVIAGAGGATGIGGAINITGGAGGSTSGDGGAVTIKGGGATGTANQAGGIIIAGGDGLAGNARAGDIEIRGGTPSGTGANSGLTFSRCLGCAREATLPWDQIPTSATAYVGIALTGTASLDFTALAANSCEVLTITVTGAADGNSVTLGVPTALADVDGATERTTFFGWVSASNTVSVRRCNVTAGATAEPAAATVRAVVWRLP